MQEHSGQEGEMSRQSMRPTPSRWEMLETATRRWFGAWMPPLRGRGGSDRKAGHSRPLRSIDAMPHKYHAERRHHIPKVQYRVRNWRDYEAGLRRRGSLTIWFT